MSDIESIKPITIQIQRLLDKPVQSALRLLLNQFLVQTYYVVGLNQYFHLLLCSVYLSKVDEWINSELVRVS